MTTKRTPKRLIQRVKLTPEAIELYKRGCEIIKARQHETWEDYGGRQREFYNIGRALENALGRSSQPWVISPLDVDDDPEPPPIFTQAWQHDEWRAAVALREQLERATKP